MRVECLDITRAALARLPDVDDAMEQAASIYLRLGQIGRACELARMLERDGYDGESGSYELAVEESYFGNRRAAFASLRRRALHAAIFRHDTETLAAGLFLNWAGERVRAGDKGGACRLLEILLRVSPGHQRGLEAAAGLRCGGGAARRPGP
jgi:hypothetical protein